MIVNLGGLFLIVCHTLTLSHHTAENEVVISIKSQEEYEYIILRKTDQKFSLFFFLAGIYFMWKPNRPDSFWFRRIKCCAPVRYVLGWSEIRTLNKKIAVIFLVISFFELANRLIFMESHFCVAFYVYSDYVLYDLFVEKRNSLLNYIYFYECHSVLLFFYFLRFDWRMESGCNVVVLGFWICNVLVGTKLYFVSFVL